jgi:hypothetical protein
MADESLHAAWVESENDVAAPDEAAEEEAAAEEAAEEEAVEDDVTEDEPKRLKRASEYPPKPMYFIYDFPHLEPCMGPELEGPQLEPLMGAELEPLMGPQLEPKVRHGGSRMMYWVTTAAPPRSGVSSGLRSLTRSTGPLDRPLASTPNSRVTITGSARSAEMSEEVGILRVI